MKKFLVLYRSTVSPMEAMASSTPEYRQAEMAKWTAWGDSLGTALVDWGAPLGESAVVGGSESPGFLGGFSIVQAESLEAAKGMVVAHPHFTSEGDSIEVLEMLRMPGS